MKDFSHSCMLAELVSYEENLCEYVLAEPKNPEIFIPACYLLQKKSGIKPFGCTSTSLTKQRNTDLLVTHLPLL